MRSQHTPALAGAVLCALLAASTRPAAAQAPCSLLTAAQIGAALGSAAGPGQPIASTACDWPASPRTERVTLTLRPAAAFDAMKMPVGGPVTKTPAGGVGDDAVYVTVGPYTTLAVKKGKVAFVVKVYGVAGQARQMAIEKTLALDVVGRL